MSRIDTFTFKINAQERQLIVALAERLNRSQSDAIRFVIRQAAHALDADPSTPVPSAQPAQPSQVVNHVEG